MPDLLESRASQRLRDLRIYTGFRKVYAHLLAAFSDGGALRRTHQMSDLFAKRSVMIGEDESSTEESLVP